MRESLRKLLKGTTTSQLLVGVALGDVVLTTRDALFIVVQPMHVSAAGQANAEGRPIAVR